MNSHWQSRIHPITPIIPHPTTTNPPSSALCNFSHHAPPNAPHIPMPLLSLSTIIRALWRPRGARSRHSACVTLIRRYRTYTIRTYRRASLQVHARFITARRARRSNLQTLTLTAAPWYIGREGGRVYIYRGECIAVPLALCHRDVLCRPLLLLLLRRFDRTATVAERLRRYKGVGERARGCW